MDYCGGVKGMGVGGEMLVCEKAQYSRAPFSWTGHLMACRPRDVPWLYSSMNIFLGTTSPST